MVFLKLIGKKSIGNLQNVGSNLPTRGTTKKANIFHAQTFLSEVTWHIVFHMNLRKQSTVTDDHDEKSSS